MIVVGASVGGVQAVQALLAKLPASFPDALAIVLHRHRQSNEMLVDIVQRHTLLKIVEPVDKQPIESCTAYIAPPDYHLLIDGDHFALSVDEPVRFARPSIDVLFESAALMHQTRVVAVVMTGGGADGARGAAAIEANGGQVIVQTPAQAVCGDMPAAAIAATRNALVLPIDAIAAQLVELTT